MLKPSTCKNQTEKVGRQKEKQEFPANLLKLQPTTKMHPGETGKTQLNAGCGICQIIRNLHDLIVYFCLKNENILIFGSRSNSKQD